MKNIKSLTAYVLIAIILISTLVSILGVWKIIDMEDVIEKILQTLLIIFVASAVTLFIFNVLIDKPGKKLPERE